MIGRNNVGGIVSYGHIAINKAYFFTGQHPVLFNEFDVSSNHYGLIVSSAVNERGFIQPPKVDDAHIQVKLCDKEKDKSIYGVFSSYNFPIETGYSPEIPTENPTKTK